MDDMIKYIEEERCAFLYEHLNSPNRIVLHPETIEKLGQVIAGKINVKPTTILGMEIIEDEDMSIDEALLYNQRYRVEIKDFK